MIFFLLILSSCSISSNRTFLTLRYKQIEIVRSISLISDMSLNNSPEDLIIESKVERYITKQEDSSNRMSILAEEDGLFTFSRVINNSLIVESFEGDEYSFNIEGKNVYLVEPESVVTNNFVDRGIKISGLDGKEISFDDKGRVKYICITESIEEKTSNFSSFDKREDRSYDDFTIPERVKRYVSKIEYDEIDSSIVGIIEEYYENDRLLLQSVSRLQKEVDFSIEKSI